MGYLLNNLESDGIYTTNDVGTELSRSSAVEIYGEVTGLKGDAGDALNFLNRDCSSLVEWVDVAGMFKLVRYGAIDQLQARCA